MILVAATAGVVVAGPDLATTVAGEPSATGTARSTVTVPAPDRTLVCPSPARLSDTESVGDAEFDARPSPTTTTLSALVVPGADDGPATLAPLGAVDGTTGDGTTADGTTVDGVATAGDVGVAQVLDAPATSAAAAAAVASTTLEGDLRGLAAAACVSPGVDHWLVGGSTEAGSSTQLVLQNPGVTPAAVTMTVAGPSGPTEISGSDRFVVAPGSQVVTLVEAGAPGLARTVVHVTSEGALVSAYLQHSTVDGIVAQGVADVVPGTGPSTRLVVPGVVSGGEDVGDEGAPVLRVLAPDADAAVTVSLLGPDGPVDLPGLDDVDLPAGAVVDLGLGGVPPGTYTAVVEATAPVVAGVELRRDGEQDPDATRDALQRDRAWIPATAPGAGAVAVPPGVVGTLVASAVPRDDDAGGALAATLVAYGADGAELASRDVDLDVGSTTTLALADLADDGPVAGVRLVTGDAPAGVEMAWGLAVSAGEPAAGATEGSLISWVAPTPDPVAEVTVQVGPADAVRPAP
ncbi:hypothetical protein Slu03_16840 [Sediminihabitans luteus]|nr:hypothetical protein Slu03_16840 [Sediminihabitans luteus]